MLVPYPVSVHPPQLREVRVVVLEPVVPVEAEYTPIKSIFPEACTRPLDEASEMPKENPVYGPLNAVTSISKYHRPVVRVNVDTT